MKNFGKLYSLFGFVLCNLPVAAQKNIIASGSLLINTSQNTSNSALRVNGKTRIDTMLSVRAASDSNSFISLHRNLKGASLGEDDLISPYTSTPTAWAVDGHIPVFRLRHPNNVSNSQNSNTSIRKDFKILPYEYGMAIEFNGIVEAWVGEWSVHKGLDYYDVEGTGNGWGAVSWVGDDIDAGGVRMTARNNLLYGGNINYGEISVEKFAGASNGDFRFRLPSDQNDFQFIYGVRGSSNIIAKMKNEGLVIPKTGSVFNIGSPEVAQMLFDNSDKKFKGYNGSEWVDISNTIVNYEGGYTISSNGGEIVYSIPHNLNVTPGYFNVIATSAAAGDINYVTANNSFLHVHYKTAPAQGVNNLSWNWQVKK